MKSTYFYIFYAIKFEVVHIHVFCVSYVTFIYVNSDICCLYLLIVVPEDGLICQNMLEAEKVCCNSTNSV